MTTRYPSGITQDPTSLTAFPPPPSPTASPSTPNTPSLDSSFSHSSGGGISCSKTSQEPPSSATAAVLLQSEPIPEDWKNREIRGIDFDHFTGRHVTVSDLVRGLTNIGFQGSNLATACQIIDEMRTWRNPEDPTQKATIFLGYTSNLVSSGLRETIRYLVQHRHVSAIVTTAGGIEEDLIKCLAPTYLGSFTLDGATLRSKGLNRIGNLLVPNSNYCKFEDWVLPILDKMLEEQESSRIDPSIPPEEKLNWTPSKVIHRLGKEINNTSSILYWAYKNNIPIFCPALTDGSLGDMLYFHSFRCPQNTQPLKIDIIEDIRRINTIAVRAKAAGMIILGGGVIKHHIANACLMRNGAEWAVIINVAGEFDGSDAGARPDEAVSWGKIKSGKLGGKMIKVYGEATIVFPIVVAATFAKPEPIIMKKPEPQKLRTEPVLRPELMHFKLSSTGNKQQQGQHQQHGSQEDSGSASEVTPYHHHRHHSHYYSRTAIHTPTSMEPLSPLPHIPSIKKPTLEKQDKDQVKPLNKPVSQSILTMPSLSTPPLSPSSTSIPQKPSTPTAATISRRPSTATSTAMATATNIPFAMALPAGVGLAIGGGPGVGVASNSPTSKAISGSLASDEREKDREKEVGAFGSPAKH